MTNLSQVNLTGARKQPMVGHNKRNSVPDDIPIRLAVTFAPSRARVIQGQFKLSMLLAIGIFNIGSLSTAHII